MKTRPPSMDDKDTPSPPVLTHAQYEANKAAGINRYGKTYDRVSWAAFAERCKAVGADPEQIDERDLVELEAKKDGVTYW